MGIGGSGLAINSSPPSRYIGSGRLVERAEEEEELGG